MKRIGGLCIAVIILVWWLLPTEPSPQQRSASSPPETAALHAGTSVAGSPLAAELHAGPDPADDVRILHGLIRQYLTALQRRAGPPIGDDADLVRALTGRNPLRFIVIPPGHPAISAEGRLLDRWGTPYHIHARSSASYEVRSAGADRRLFTADDLSSDGGM
jgi:hypothetical protein